MFLTLGFLIPLYAANKTVRFDIDYKTVKFAGRPVQALAINNQIPGPSLHFEEGDNVTIEVFNHLHEETAVHWHGLLVPWQMDGVLGVSQKGIPPNSSFRYHFKLMQAGTYWYHAHAGLQEQRGLYGALIIAPKTKEPYHYDQDFPMVLSDWSNTKPEAILANLKKEGSYYSVGFPLQASLQKFIRDYWKGGVQERKALIEDYRMMEQSRMGLYDMSDVAYDALLLNGKTIANPWTKRVEIGDLVRLRFIGASGATIFNVKIPGSRMQMVHINGNDVKPFEVDSFSIAPGETFDLLLKIEEQRPYIVYAESIDTSKKIYGALITKVGQYVPFQDVAPFKEPKPPMRTMMHLMMEDMHKPNKMTGHHHHPGMVMPESQPMQHRMAMPTEPAIFGDKFTKLQGVAVTKGTKYQKIEAAVPTNDPKKHVDAVIRMELFGYMDRFIWFINGVPEYKAKPIVLQPNKRYRFVFTNPSMMRHPMHLHGHWFILRTGHGAFDPLLHTLDIPAGATVTADVDTDASGQWFFHCHLLYHMMTGMSRIFQYTTLLELVKGRAKVEDSIKQTGFINRPIVRVDTGRFLYPDLVKHPMAHPPGFYAAQFLTVGTDPIHNVQMLDFRGMYGPDYHKLQLLVKDAELDQNKLENADVDIFYWHLLNQFWAIKGGVNYFNRPALKPYWPIGIGLEGLMPYFIETDVRAYYYHGALKLDAEFARDSQMTNNFFIKTSLRSILATKTIALAQIGQGFNQLRAAIRPYYRVIPGLQIFFQYEYQRNFGAFGRLQKDLGEQKVQNTVNLGFSFMF